MAITHPKQEKVGAVQKIGFPEALEYPCTACGADVGEPCMPSMRVPHLPRIRKALGQLGRYV